MKKYWQYFKNSLSLATAYRGSTLIWSLISTIEIFSALVFWLAVYGNKPEIAGFSKSNLISYYMMLFLLERFIEVHPQERISEDIRHGFLSAFLLKPFPYLLDRAVTTLGGKLISFLVSTPALLLVFYLFREYFVIKTNSPLIFLVILSILLSYALQLLLGLLIGLVAFWIQKVRNLFSFYYIAFSLLGGGTVPLALFPKTLQTLASILPFRYVYSLPLEIYFERLSLHAILFGVLIQVLWILITLVTLRFVWKRGLRYYSAVGG